MATPAALDDAIAALNNRLKAARLGLQVERRGDRLSLRGTLPPAPTASKLGPISSAFPSSCPPPQPGSSRLSARPR